MNETYFEQEKSDIASKRIYGIDKEIDLVKIAKAYMSLIGDGKSNIVCQNTLHEPMEYSDKAKAKFISKGRFKQFNVILTNPPFGITR